MTATGEQSSVPIIVFARTLRRAENFTTKSAQVRVPCTFNRLLNARLQSVYNA